MKRKLHQLLHLAGVEVDAVRVLLRWGALPVTDRRWAAPLAAIALGFGLFAGVAIGPGAAGTFATGAAQIIEIPRFSGGDDAGEEGDEGGDLSSTAASSAGVASGGGGSSIPRSGSALPSSGATLPSFTAPSPPEAAQSPESSPDPPEQTGPNLAISDALAVDLPDAPTASQCADLSTILWQIYTPEPSALPFADAAALQAWLCPDVPHFEHP
jgi:hypothetical protein